MLHNLIQSNYAWARYNGHEPWPLAGFPDKDWPAEGEYLFELSSLEHMEAALSLNYSVIFANFVLGYPSQKDLRVLLTKLYARLNPGGLMLVKENVSVTTPPTRQSYQGATYQSDALVKMFEEAGFVTVFTYLWESETAEPQLFVVLSKETIALTTLKDTLTSEISNLVDYLELNPIPEVSPLKPYY